MRRTRVLVVDADAGVRQAMAAILTADPDLEVTTASDPRVAARHIAQTVPDVITLDVEMPPKDGLTFLRKLMAQRPRPVVLCSSLVEEGSATLLDALEAGAVDVILKPRVDVVEHLTDAHVQIRAPGRARVPPATSRRASSPPRRCCRRGAARR
ncbi:chemotaxis response regulator CheB [Sphingomonas sp. BK580]|nr:response regulator [Sphingomonas sp. BK580]MBB3693739.1 chemotaxis response regulator CheB [Sphingomonas sp. BK580]